jgi:hypothetical protein
MPLTAMLRNKSEIKINTIEDITELVVALLIPPLLLLY